MRLATFVHQNISIMTTIKLNAPAHWSDESATQKHESAWGKFMAFADGQTKHRTIWFLGSLMVQGVLLLPVPAVLMYYYNAPIMVLVVTMTLFFANVIAGMGGSSIRIMISLFALSVLVHLFMLAVFII
jgi:hypothetical protein